MEKYRRLSLRGDLACPLLFIFIFIMLLQLIRVGLVAWCGWRDAYDLFILLRGDGDADIYSDLWPWMERALVWLA